MYEPNKKETLVMKAYEDLGYAVWWNGYDIIATVDSYTRIMVEQLVDKGWIKG